MKLFFFFSCSVYFELMEVETPFQFLFFLNSCGGVSKGGPVFEVAGRSAVDVWGSFLTTGISFAVTFVDLLQLIVVCLISLHLKHLIISSWINIRYTSPSYRSSADDLLGMVALWS